MIKSNNNEAINTQKYQQPQEHQHAISSRQQQLRQVLDKIMPEIEKQLIHDIQQQLDLQFEQTFLKRVHQMDTQALSQYQQALQELQQSRTLLQKEKDNQLQQEIISLQHMLEEMKSQHLMKLQQEYLQKNFDTIIMVHTDISSLEKQLEEEIFLLLQPKHEITKSRQIKELIMTHETKQIKLRKQLDQQIKSKIYYSSGLQQLKHQIKQSKTQMGSQKSQYNLRLKKIQSEIKQYQEKINAIQKMGDVDKLEEEYQQLKIVLLEQEQDQYERYKQNNYSKRNGTNNNNNGIDNQQQHRNNDGDEFSNDDDDQKQQSDNEQQQYDSNNNPQNYYYSAESQGYSYQHNNGHTNRGNNKLNNTNTNKNKFDLTAYFNHYIERNQQKHVEDNHQPATTNYHVGFTDNNMNNQQPTNSLLNLKNISAILKQKVTQQDPLEKYIQSSQKENNPNNNNNKPNQSNFAILYQQHLKNLNKGFAKKAAINNNKNNKSKQTAGLSQMAKKTIIRNLAQHHKSNFSNTVTKQQPQSKRISTFEEQSPQGLNNKAYETNLLAGGDV